MLSNMVIINKIIKLFFIFLLKLYQVIRLPFPQCCRFQPTCSQYAINSISKYGIIRGICLTLKRLMKCQPFYKIKEKDL